MTTIKLHDKENFGWVIKFKIWWAGNIARMEEGTTVFKILTGNSTGWGPLGRPMRSWEDDIRMSLKEIGVNMRTWVDSVQDTDY